MPILATGYYESVRAALHVSLTAQELPDDLIDLGIYKDRAEREVARRVPDWEDKTGEEAAAIVRAAVLLLASYIAPSVTLLESESIPGGGYRYTRPEVNWTDKARILGEAADAEIQSVVAPSAATPGRPTLFGVAQGRRGA